ncbi:hypothetical protein B7463_g11198, partial [Scytalidium lignicola]
MNFRSFVQALREDDDLAEIDIEVSANLEAAAITRYASEAKSKAPLFNNISNTYKGLFRIFGAPTGLRSNDSEKYGRLARHVGLPKTAGLREVTDKVNLAEGVKSIPPVIVATGFCKENKIFGEDIDLNKIPCPKLHNLDGGKYLQTYGIHILQSPDGKWTNWAIARAMVYDKTRLVGTAVGPQDIARLSRMWKAVGKDEIPWALALGAPPAAVVVSGMPLPAGVSEGEYISTVIGSAIEVVKCETNDIFVPANSEIVLEGTMSSTNFLPEGPFGEMHGYTFPESGSGLVFTVKAITYRNDAILPICVPGRAADETQVLSGIVYGARILQVCKKHDLPVKNVAIPEEAQAVWAVVQVDTTRIRAENTNAKDLCERIGRTIFAEKCGIPFHRIFVVGEDIDPFKFKDVMWVFSTRCRPGVDEFTFDDAIAYPLVPFIKYGLGDKTKGGKVVSNCMLPMEYTTGPSWEVADFHHAYPKDIQDKVLSQLKMMGY